MTLQPSQPLLGWITRKLRLVANANTLWFTENKVPFLPVTTQGFVSISIAAAQENLFVFTPMLEASSHWEEVLIKTTYQRDNGTLLLGIQGSFVAVQNLKCSMTLCDYAVGRRESIMLQPFSPRFGRAFSPSAKRSTSGSHAQGRLWLQPTFDSSSGIFLIFRCSINPIKGKMKPRKPERAGATLGVMWPPSGSVCLWSCVLTSREESEKIYGISGWGGEKFSTSLKGNSRRFIVYL